MEAKDYSKEEVECLAQSIVCVLMSRVKMQLLNPKKNKKLAADPDFRNLLFTMAEQLIPKYLESHISVAKDVDLLHSLCFLLAQKCTAVFQNGVIHTCIN